MALEKQKKSLPRDSPHRRNTDGCTICKKPSLYRARRKLVFEDRSGGGPMKPDREDGVMEEHRDLLAEVQAAERRRCINRFNYNSTTGQILQGRLEWEPIQPISSQVVEAGEEGSRISLVH